MFDVGGSVLSLGFWSSGGGSSDDLRRSIPTALGPVVLSAYPIDTIEINVPEE